MKSKLVKYPFDEKKYRWDTWYQGKEFKYYWDESLPNNFETIEPYIKTKDVTIDDIKNNAAIINLTYNNEDYGKRLEEGVGSNKIITDEKFVYGQTPNEVYKLCHETITSPFIYSTSGWVEKHSMKNKDVDNIFVVKPTEVYYYLEYNSTNDIYYVWLGPSKTSSPFTRLSTAERANVKKLDYEAELINRNLGHYIDEVITDKLTLKAMEVNYYNYNGEWTDEQWNAWCWCNNWYQPCIMTKCPSYALYIEDEYNPYLNKTYERDNYFITNKYYYPYGHSPELTQEEQEIWSNSRSHCYDRNWWGLILQDIKLFNNLPSNAKILFNKDRINANFTTEIYWSFKYIVNGLGFAFAHDSQLEEYLGDYSFEPSPYHDGPKVLPQYIGNKPKMSSQYPHLSNARISFTETIVPSEDDYPREYQLYQIANNAINNWHKENQRTDGQWWRQPYYIGPGEVPQDWDGLNPDGTSFVMGAFSPTNTVSDYRHYIKEEKYLCRRGDVGFTYISYNQWEYDWNNIGFTFPDYLFKSLFGIENGVINISTKRYKKYDIEISENSNYGLTNEEIRYLINIKASIDLISGYIKRYKNRQLPLEEIRFTKPQNYDLKKNGKFAGNYIYKNYENIEYDKLNNKITIYSNDACKELIDWIKEKDVTGQFYPAKTEFPVTNINDPFDGFMGIFVSNVSIPESKLSLPNEPNRQYGDKYMDYLTNVGKSNRIVNNFTPVLSHKEGDLLIDIRDWPANTPYIRNDSIDIYQLSRYFDNKVVLPDVKLIGDQTSKYAIVPEDNEDILHYTIGEVKNNVFQEKTLLLNAPNSYYKTTLTQFNGWKVNPNINTDGCLTTEYDGETYYILGALDADGALYKDGNVYVAENWIEEDYDGSYLDYFNPPIEKKEIHFSVQTYYYEIKGNTIYEDNENIKNSYWYQLLSMAYNAFIDNIITQEITDKTTVNMAFNYYTPTEWFNGYHFTGNNWNSVANPFSYLSDITNENGNRTMTYLFDVCPPGTYLNLLLAYDGGLITDDTKDVSYISPADTRNTYRKYWDDNVGGLWYFGTGEVSSTDRHAYPDNGSQNYHSYRLKPEKTTFLNYYRVRDTYNNIELFSDRYHYTQETVDFCDRSYEGTVCGTPTSTGEENIPDGTWREYMGLYLGESIPFLNITETVVSPKEILGVPAYDKQVNTSDTIKYGTVASASLSFVLNKPVGECMELNNQLLVLYYDFKNRNNWERIGFMRVDTIEAIDEYTTSLVAHDETYKLNKYVDDFLENYKQATTLDKFYRDLLDYCGCFYDEEQPLINNGNLAMNNIYHAVKTTGIQVAHYIAILVPGFIHTNIDGDIVMSQYKLKDEILTTKEYSNLVYNAYNTDKINKVKITSSNAVKGESNGSGINTYYLADDPLLSELQLPSYFNNLANSIMLKYNDIPTYRPATVNFLALPKSIEIGDIVDLRTPKNEEYKVIVMRMAITGAGVEIQSYGTQKYPVEAESNSEFVNLINDMGEISGDVSNIMEAQETMANAISQNRADIGNNTLSISNIITKNTEQDTAISNNATNISNIMNGYKSTQNNDLATIILSNTLNNVALKGYVDGVGTNTLNSAKAYVDSKLISAFSVKVGTIHFKRNIDPVTNYTTAEVFYIGNQPMTYGLFFPLTYVSIPDISARAYFFQVQGTEWRAFTQEYGDSVSWRTIYDAYFTEN